MPDEEFYYIGSVRGVEHFPVNRLYLTRMNELLRTQDIGVRLGPDVMGNSPALLESRSGGVYGFGVYVSQRDKAKDLDGKVMTLSEAHQKTRREEYRRTDNQMDR